MANVLPPLTKDLRKYLSEPGALSITEFVEHLRQTRSPFHDNLAESFERHQQYLDALGTIVGSVLSYLQASSIKSLDMGDHGTQLIGTGLALTTTPTLIPNLSFVVDRAGIWRFTVDVNISVDYLDANTNIDLRVNGTPETGVIIGGANVTGGTAILAIPASRTWRVPSLVSGDTVEIFGQKLAGAGGSQVFTGGFLNASWVGED